MRSLLQLHRLRLTGTLLVLAAVFLATVTGCGISGSSVSLVPPVTSADERLATAELIVRAVYVDAATHPRPIISPVDGQAHGEVIEVFKHFDVIEVLKGDFEAGRSLFVNNAQSVVLDSGHQRGASDLNYSPGAEYVLFLESRPAYESDPAEYGTVRWNVARHPGAARLDGDRLLFLMSDAYREMFRETDVEFPDPDSGAPFLMTLSEIREKTATGS